MIRTRFAPSPTGYLHIGGVRTALFNWLFARRHGGHFILRIDDTDRRRNIEAALAPILDGFRWVGIDWDEGPEVGGDYGPYYQSERSASYQAAVEELIEKDLAYRDYSTTEDMETERAAARQADRPFVYSRKWKGDTEEHRREFEAAGRNGVVRLKMPRQGQCRFRDLVRGDMVFDWDREQDHVIQRADGTCLYHLASVVDDHGFAISHVIRAEEHLSNTPRQIFIAQGLGYELPEYAHLPYVAEPGSKNKLSKRKLDKYLKHSDFADLAAHGQAIAAIIGLDTEPESFNPVVVDFYREVGFLPQALVNYLLLLGWSLDDRTEFLTRQDMIDNFSLERVQAAPASFDPVKLWAFQEHYMQQLELDAKVDLALPFVEKAAWVPTPVVAADRARITAIVAAAGDRIKAAGDILDYEDLFVADDELGFDAKAFDKRLRKAPEAAALLADFSRHVEATDDFTAAALEHLMRSFVEERGIKIGQVIHALRVAVTGKAVGFGMFEILEILGKQRTVSRIDRALGRLANSA